MRMIKASSFIKINRAEVKRRVRMIRGNVNEGAGRKKRVKNELEVEIKQARG